MGKIKKSNPFLGKNYPSGYQNQSKSEPYLVSIFNEKYNNFLLKNQEVEVRLAPVFQKPLIKSWLAVKKFSGSLFESRVIPAFVSFYFLTSFFDFGPF